MSLVTHTHTHAEQNGRTSFVLWAERIQLRLSDDDGGKPADLHQDRLLQGAQSHAQNAMATSQGGANGADAACVLQGNLAAMKFINKKRIELTRKVLFELKHVRTRVT